LNNIRENEEGVLFLMNTPYSFTQKSQRMSNINDKNSENSKNSHESTLKEI